MKDIGWEFTKMKKWKCALFLFPIFLLLLSGCAKRGMLVKCPKDDYDAFLNAYRPIYEIDSLSGNGNIEIEKADNELFGKFAIVYSKKQRRWAITLYGIFGMVLSEVEIKDDRINITSSLLDKPIKGPVKDFNLEGYTGIPLDPTYIPLLTTGRIPVNTSGFPSSCIKKNENLTEFLFREANKNIRIGWEHKNNRIEYFQSSEKKGGDLLEVKFSDFKNVNSLLFPHSILFIIKGKDEAYLKLKYSYIKIK